MRRSEINGDKLKNWGPRFQSTKLITWKYVVLHKVVISNCMLSKNTTILTKDQAIMIYRIGKGLPVNFGQFAFNAIMKASPDVDGSILYPYMIFQVLKNQGCPQLTPDLVIETPLIFQDSLHF